MKITREVEVPAIPATTKQVVDLMQCDLCGRQRRHDDDWSDSCYKIADTTIECEVGTNYPGSYDTEKWEVDICPDCFVDRLVPWINSQNPDLPTVKPKEISF